MPGADRSWMRIVFPIGKKHKGETLGAIYYCDNEYLLWCIENIIRAPKEILRALRQAETYINEVDPWSTY